MSSITTDLAKLTKGYESQLLHLTSQILALKRSNQQLAIQNLRVQSLFTESNRMLHQKDTQLLNKQKKYAQLEKENQELQKLLQKAQRHRKLLYDQLHVQQPAQSDSGVFLHRLYNISRQFSDKSLLELQQLIVNRNKQISKVCKQYNDLRQEHLKSTNQYHIKITKLKEENEILKNNQKRIGDANRLLGKTQWKEVQQLNLIIRSLNQRIQILSQKIKTDTQIISTLKIRLAQLENNQSEQKVKSREHIMEPEVQQYLNMVKQNQRLRQQFQEVKEKLSSLEPYLQGNALDSSDDLAKTLQLIKQAKRNKHDLSITTIRLETAQAELQSKQKQKKRISQKLQEKTLLLQKTKSFYKQIIEKFIQFFKMVNPHFEVYRYDQLGLTSEEQQAITIKQKQVSQDTNIKLNLSQHQQRVRNLEQSLKQKKIEIQKYNSLLEDKYHMMVDLKAANEKLIKAMKKQQDKPGTGQDDKFINLLMQSYSQIQQERNKLILQVRERQIKIMELVGEVCQLNARKQRSTNIKSDELKPDEKVVGIAQSRPGLVFVELNADVKNVRSKVQQLERQIIKQNQKHLLEMKLLSSSHLTQTATLKQKIMQLQHQNSTLKKQRQATKLLATSQQTPVAEPIIQQSGTMLQLEEKMSQHQEIDNQANTLAPETVEQMNSILKFHENNTKNLVDAYNQLKKRFVKLESEVTERSNDEEVREMRNKLEQYTQLIKVMKTRLNQSDRNLVLLEDQLQQKTGQVQELKQENAKQKQLLNKCIKQLQQQLEASRKQNWMESSSPLTLSQIAYFPEELSYLLQQVVSKEQKLKMIKKSQSLESGKQIQEDQRRLEGEFDRKSGEYKAAEEKQIQQLIGSGRLLEILQKLKETVDNSKNQTH